MRSVWSFWSKPFEYDRHSAWLSEKHHLLSWVLSVETARRQYPDTCLITDTHGARMLVDTIGLSFEKVSTSLDAMDDYHPDWWALGKLHAYRCQSEPFVHIDSDVYLWKRLPEKVENASVFAQSPEYFSLDGGSWYRPRECVGALKKTRGWVPIEWQWFVDHQGNKAACCGIVGGNDVDFIHHYADLGIRSVRSKENFSGWSSLGGNMGDNLTIEQYSLIACIEYRNQIQKDLEPVDIEYLFEGPEQAFNEDCARTMGYTHLIGGAKRNQILAERLEDRVRGDYPDLYEACLRYQADTGISA